jgi:hypothetical protein
MTALSGRRFVSPISAPGPRLLGRVPLRSVRSRSRARVLGFELPLVSFIDCLLCLILFLLASFSADAECAERERVPSAENAVPGREAPVVSITSREVLIDGVPAGSTEEIVRGGRLARLDGLFNLLKSKRDLWRQLHPNEEFPGVAVLQIERRVPSLVVKSAFQTAAYAGYPNISFLVRKR